MISAGIQMFFKLDSNGFGIAPGNQSIHQSVAAAIDQVVSIEAVLQPGFSVVW